MEPVKPTEIEKEKVNEVYDKIAPHFSATRYKVDKDPIVFEEQEYSDFRPFAAVAARRQVSS